MPTYTSPFQRSRSATSSKPTGAVNAINLMPGHPNYQPPAPGPLTRPAYNNRLPMQWQGHTIPPSGTPYESPAATPAGAPPNLGPAPVPAPPQPMLGPSAPAGPAPSASLFHRPGMSPDYRPPAIGEMGRLGLGAPSYVAGRANDLSQIQMVEGQRSPQSFPGTAAGSAMQPAMGERQGPGSLFNGVDPARIFRNPGLAGQVSPQTYMGMQNAIDQGNQNAATTRRNIGVFEGMAPGNPVGEQADRVIAGGPINLPLGPVAAQYGNIPDPNLPAVTPRYGQTALGAQQEYVDTREQARNSTNNRVAQMLQSGGRYEQTTPGPLFGGTMKGRSGQTLSISRVPGGGVRVQGSVPADEWNAQPSADPEARAQGLSRSQANAAVRATERERIQGINDRRLINLAGRNRISPKTNASVFSAMQRQKMPIPGMAQQLGQASTAPKSTAIPYDEAGKWLATADPKPWADLGVSVDTPDSLTAEQIFGAITHPNFDRLSKPAQRRIQQDVAAWMARYGSGEESRLTDSLFGGLNSQFAPGLQAFAGSGDVSRARNTAKRRQQERQQVLEDSRVYRGR